MPPKSHSCYRGCCRIPPSVRLSYTSLKTGKTILKLNNLHYNLARTTSQSQANLNQPTCPTPWTPSSLSKNSPMNKKTTYPSFPTLPTPLLTTGHKLSVFVSRVLIHFCLGSRTKLYIAQLLI